MDSDEKLRLEIEQLSNLIASQNGEFSRTNQMTSSARTVNQFSIRQNPSTYRQSLSSTNSAASSSSRQPFRYPNPFDKYCNDSYINGVFPSPLNSTRVSNTVLIRDNSTTAIVTSSSYTSPSYASQYKLKNVTNGIVKSSTLKVLTEVPVPTVEASSTTAAIIKTEQKPMSIYVNPTVLAKVNSGLSFAQNGVRPHINPAHSAFQIFNANSSKNPQFTNVTTVSAASSSTNYEFSLGQTTSSMISTNKCDTTVAISSESKSLQQATSMNSSTANVPKIVTTNKYKLDRRVKRSPVRKNSKTKIASPNKLQSSPRTKLFKTYSMRTVPTNSKFSVSGSWEEQKRVIKPPLAANHIFEAPTARSRSKKPVRKGPRSVVHIDGNKFITKNGGKTLKRMTSKTNVVSINGNRFVRKNGGKSLKRLSESISSKSKSVSIYTPHQTPGIRLANRALKKSKHTLSQRIWKKKRFCVFYNRFGECKRKDNGSCPYIHDRKQLMICPKFIVGKCTDEDCKLSHDLKLGRMPPCQFFNKSECSRENCPYPHIKSSPHAKKSSETIKLDKDQEKGKSNPTRKRKVSVKYDVSSPVKKAEKKKKKKIDCTDPKSRYYEQSPASTPVVSIIPRPRRMPLGTRKETNAEENKLTAAPAIAPSASTSSTDKVVNLNVFPVANDSSNDAITSIASNDRRMRLMSKISKLHERAKKKESSAPQFLPFK